MEWFSKLKRRIRLILKRRQLERDLHDELAFHIAMREQKLRDAGEPSAPSAARTRFGNRTGIEEDCREVWVFGALERLAADIRYSLRSLRRNRLLTITAIVCLAIGIGGTTAVFSVVNGVLIPALPYPDSDRLVVLRTVNRETIGEDQGRVSAAEFRDWQTNATSFESLAGYKWMTVDLLEPDHSERLQGLWVTPEFFSAFGIQPSAGHLFGADEPPGMILGHALWERRFGLDPAIVGRTIPIGICCPQKPQTSNVPVAGAVGYDVVFPPTLPGIRDQGHGLNDVIDYWAPLSVQHATRPGQRELQAIGKLKPGVTVAQAQAEMNLIARHLEATYPDTNRGWTIRVIPIADELLSNLHPILLLFAGAAAFVLLIACSNVAVLLTFNAVGRLHEIAVRSALGAGGRRLIRQFVSESIILTLCGGLAGLLVALAVKKFLIRLAPPNLPRLNQVSLDLRVLAFALFVTLVCGIVVGLIPGSRILKFDLESTLRAENSRNATSHSRARTYEPLLVLQVALTVALMIGSGLMIKSLDRLLAVTPGFRVSNLLTTTLSLPSAKHEWSYNAQFGERIVEQIKALPAIENAAYIRGVPLDGNEVRLNGPFWPSEKAVVDPSKELMVRLRVVSRNYFATMGIPLNGRDFTAADEAGEKIGSSRVVIINDALARLFWPGRSAVGRKLNKSETEVIGVAGNVRYAAMDSEAIPEVYLPAGLFPQDQFSIVVRTAADPAAVTSSIRTAIHDIESDVFISQFQTMDEVVANSVSRQRFTMLLLSAFSVTGVLLAVVGIAGTVAYSLSMRLREVGIRVAMGAGPRSVVLLMSRQGLAPAFAGLIAGLPLALALTRYLRQMLYGVSPHDPAVFTISALTLALVSILAAGVSAYRACRVDASSLLK